MFKYELGDQVQCRITKFKGIVIARADYIAGCRTYNVVAKDGEKTKSFDEEVLKLRKNKPRITLHAAPSGGPDRAIPSHRG